MLDINFIRENSQKVENIAKRRRMKVDIQKLIQLDEQRREAIVELDQLRSERNKISDSVPKLSDSDKKAAITRVRAIKEQYR